MMHNELFHMSTVLVSIGDSFLPQKFIYLNTFEYIFPGMHHTCTCIFKGPLDTSCFKKHFHFILLFMDHFLSNCEGSFFFFFHTVPITYSSNSSL